MFNSDFDVLAAHPKYISGAICSQAGNLSKKLSTKDLKVACFTAAIAKYIKIANSVCFASPETLLVTYNSLAPKFSLSPISRSTLFSIQALAISTGIIDRVSRYENSTGRTQRFFTINVQSFAAMFPAAFKKALRHAKQLLQRTLDYGRYLVDKSKKKLKNKELIYLSTGDGWTIRENIGSKDLKNKNKHTGNKPDATFFKSRFKEDCDRAYQLQEAARSGSITASGAKALIGLHIKHGVHIDSGFKRFLNFRILSAPKATKRKNTTHAPSTNPKRPESPVCEEISAEKRASMTVNSLAMVEELKKRFGLRSRS